MPRFRIATAERDAALITMHRHLMFSDNDFATPQRLANLDIPFEEWVRSRLQDGRYVGILLEEDGDCVAGAGIVYAEFPPHYLDLASVRPYLLNFYTNPSWRGKGLARMLLQEAIKHCRARGYEVVTLHASKFGRPVYEDFGFEQSNELMLRITQ